jgi:hypothetical protein
MGGWYNPLGDYYLVRQSDAHAWTEVWLPDTGWTRVDPTAAVSPMRVQQGSLGALSAPRHLLDYRWLRHARNSIDIVQQRWNDWVIEYGARQQARLFAPLGLDRATPAMLVSLLFAAIVIFGAILLPIVMRIRGPGRTDPIQIAWRRFLRRLEKAGFAPRPSSGAIEMATEAAEILPYAATSIRQIAELYTRCRYAPGTQPLPELQAAVKGFRPSRNSA